MTRDREIAAPSDERLSPDRARQVLDARFAAAGLALEPGAAIELDGEQVVLDGYDPARDVGYLYFPADPGDPDRSDAAQAMSRAARALASDIGRHILFVFEDDMPSIDVLERRIDAFFTTLPRS